MGQTLSEPITQKTTSSEENEKIKVAASCMQGWRIDMEDSHVLKLCLDDEKDQHFFAVYDGHGGAGSAKYATKQLDNLLVEQLKYNKGDIKNALITSFMTFDEELKSQSSTQYNDSSGTTAVSVLMQGNKIYCANVGDSRAIASVRGHPQLLSFDHKPQHDRERKRIEAAGGFVENFRVNGNLALSRAFGDFSFKKNSSLTAEEQIVTAHPDIIMKEVTDDHEFIVLASDGIWDVMTNQDVVEFIRAKFAKNIEPEEVCEQLMDYCLADRVENVGIGSDNMTVVIITFKSNGSFDELCKKCIQSRSNPIPPCCLLSSYPSFVRGGIGLL